MEREKPEAKILRNIVSFNFYFVFSKSWAMSLETIIWSILFIRFGSAEIWNIERRRDGFLFYFLPKTTAYLHDLSESGQPTNILN